MKATLKIPTSNSNDKNKACFQAHVVGKTNTIAGSIIELANSEKLQTIRSFAKFVFRQIICELLQIFKI